MLLNLGRLACGIGERKSRHIRSRPVHQRLCKSWTRREISLRHTNKLAITCSFVLTSTQCVPGLTFCVATGTSVPGCHPFSDDPLEGRFHRGRAVSCHESQDFSRIVTNSSAAVGWIPIVVSN